MDYYCDKCNVQLEPTVSHCPLCGRCVNENLIKEKNTHENFPSDKQFKKERQEALRAIFWFLVLGNILSIFAELMLEGTFTWSLHILVASAFAFFAFILPIRNNWYLVNCHSMLYILFTPYIIFLENYTHSFGWGITYVIPLFALIFSIYNFGMVLSNINNRSDYILPMFILFIIATVSFLFNYLNHLTVWPSLAAFFAIITFISVCFIFRSTKILKALSKKFHI